MEGSGLSRLYRISQHLVVGSSVRWIDGWFELGNVASDFVEICDVERKLWRI